MFNLFDHSRVLATAKNFHYAQWLENKLVKPSPKALQFFGHAPWPNAPVVPSGCVPTGAWLPAILQRFRLVSVPGLGLLAQLKCGLFHSLILRLSVG